MVEEKKMQEFAKCPACGKEGTAAAQARDEFVAKGAIPKDLTLVLATLNLPLVNPHTAVPGIPIPVLVAHLDACVHCGCLYCVKIGRQMIPTVFRNPPR